MLGILPRIKCVVTIGFTPAHSEADIFSPCMGIHQMHPQGPRMQNLQMRLLRTRIILMKRGISPGWHPGGTEFLFPLYRPGVLRELFDIAGDVDGESIVE